MASETTHMMMIQPHFGDNSFPDQSCAEPLADLGLHCPLIVKGQFSCINSHLADEAHRRYFLEH